MSKFIDPEELKITEIFSENDYIIPIYQRSYAWEKDQIEQLMMDIYDSKDTEKYYLGSLIVDKEDNHLFSVIDGQQRLTTLFLLLTYLAPEFISTNLRFEARDKSNRTLDDYRYGRITEDKSSYSPEILHGRTIIEKFFSVKDELDAEYREVFKKKLANVVIIRTQVPEKIDLNHYFEIMNTRGEQLEIHEIAKERLLSVIKDKEKKEKAAIIWDACSQMDKYIQMNFDTENRSNIFNTEWNEFLPKNPDELFSLIKLSSQQSEKKFSLLSKLQDLEPADEEEDVEEEENERFESIISFPNFLLIVNEALGTSEDDDSLDDKKFISSLKKHWDNVNKDEADKTACHFIFSMLKMRYLFDSYIVKREYAKDYKEEGKWSLQKLQRYEYLKNNKNKPNYLNTFEDSLEENLRHLQAGLRITYTSPKTMHWISHALNKLSKNEQCNLLSVLEKYACDKVEDADYMNAKGFGIERIVFTYLDYILVKDDKSGLFSDFYFQFRNSIEHFYPQNPDQTQSMKEWDRRYLDDFGNLALITVNANSKFSNSIPTAKVADNPNTIRQSPKLIIMSKLLRENKNLWPQDLAIKHGEEMRKLLTDEIQKKGKQK
ncbi:MAG: DUF262 domain-containing protein [Treponema sp.]